MQFIWCIFPVHSSICINVKVNDTSYCWGNNSIDWLYISCHSYYCTHQYRQMAVPSTKSTTLYSIESVKLSFNIKLIFIKTFQCILSSVIVVALKGVLFQVKDFPGILKKSKLDGLLWVGPFFGVILLDIKLGFVICISLAILIMTYRNYKIDILEFGIEDDDSHSTSQSNSSNSSVLRVSCTIHFTIFISQFYKI